MTIRELFDQFKSQYQNQDFFKNIRIIEDLVGFYMGLEWAELQIQVDAPVSESQLEKINQAMVSLAQGIPLAHIVGEKFFYKSTFKTTPDALIPRPETEILVEQAVSLLSEGRCRVLDLGSGSGCIGLSVALEKPDSDVFLFEASEKALNLSRLNGSLLNVSNAYYHLCEIGFDNFPLKEEPVDLVLANPPYIEWGDSRVEASVHKNEPHLALYCGEKGLFCIKNWLVWIYPHIKEGGFALFEFGQGQETAIADFIRTTDYSIIEIIEDYSRIKRFIKLQK